MTKAASDERACADLPCDPTQRLSTSGGIGWQELAELLCQMDQDCCRFKNAEGFVTAAIFHCWNFRVWVESHEPAGELLTLADVYGVGIVFCAFVAQLKQFLEHDRDLYAIGRCKRVELEGVLADRQIFLFARAGSRAVDIGKAAAAFGVY